MSAQARYSTEPVALLWPTVSRAKRLMRQGHSLNEAAAMLGVRPCDLDASLWRHLGVSL